MLVTPELATKWLEGNVHNRNLVNAKVARIADDIRRGEWKITHQGVAFAPDGLLIDGQHRLWAIVEAGIAVHVNVTFNAPKDSFLVVDKVTPRDASTRMGLSNGQSISKMDVAVLRVVEWGVEAGGGGRRDAGAQVTDSMLLDAWPKHADAIRFAMDALPYKKGISTGSTWAVIARAYYTQNHDRLRQFGAILAHGVTTGEPEDAVVISLREWLVKTNGTALSLRRMHYGKTERALLAFIRKETIKRIIEADGELFPIPSETSTADMQVALN